MLQLVFQNRVVKVLVAIAFITSTMLFGFSSYTSQKIQEASTSKIFANPSQLPSSEMAYLPPSVVQQAELSPDLQNNLTATIAELVEAGSLKQVICSGRLYRKLSQMGLPAMNYLGEPATIHEEISYLLEQHPAGRILLIADRNYLEQGLYVIRSRGVDGVGLDISHQSRGFELPKYLARFKLYLDCELSKSSPLIANPRYTLDIQH